MTSNEETDFPRHAAYLLKYIENGMTHGIGRISWETIKTALRKCSAVETAAELRDYETVRGAYDQAVAELDKYMTWHANGRSNVEFVDGGVRICRGRHEKYDPCEWAEYKSVVETSGTLEELIAQSCDECGFIGHTHKPTCSRSTAKATGAPEGADVRSTLDDIYRSLCAAWDNRTLPASVLSADQFTRMREALDIPFPGYCKPGSPPNGTG